MLFSISMIPLKLARNVIFVINFTLYQISFVLLSFLNLDKTADIPYQYLKVIANWIRSNKLRIFSHFCDLMPLSHIESQLFSSYLAAVIYMQRCFKFLYKSSLKMFSPVLIKNLMLHLNTR